jgi:hypothetical protein
MNSIDRSVTNNESNNIQYKKPFVHSNDNVTNDNVTNDNVTFANMPSTSKLKKTSKKRKSFKNLMSEITSKTTTLEEEKSNHKDQLQAVMQHAQFNKVERI